MADSAAMFWMNRKVQLHSGEEGTHLSESIDGMNSILSSPEIELPFSRWMSSLLDLQKHHDVLFCRSMSNLSRKFRQF